MATNLRLSEQAAAAVRAEAERTGRSQQDVIRAAVDQYLESPVAPSEASRGRPASSFRDEIIPPRMPFQHNIERVSLPEGVSSLDLLDREDRI
jgi:hypothetical protein